MKTSLSRLKSPKLFQRNEPPSDSKEIIVVIKMKKDQVQFSIKQLSNQFEQQYVYQSSETQTKTKRKSLLKKKMKYTIQFDKNEIEIGTNDGFQLFTVNELIITYQHKQYTLQICELVAIYFYMIKREIEKEYIIKYVELHKPKDEKHFQKDMFIKAFQLIGIYEITINTVYYHDVVVDEKDYETIEEIIVKHQQYLEYKHKIVEMQKIMNDKLDTSHQELLTLQPNESYKTKKLEAIKKELTFKERSMYKLCQLDNTYCLYITSKYFETINDYINFEMVSRRIKGNREKFKYNPIPLSQQSRSFFPNIQQHFLYNPNDYRIGFDKKITKTIFTWIEMINSKHIKKHFTNFHFCPFFNAFDMF